jgi:hypothetical protein
VGLRRNGLLPMDMYALTVKRLEKRAIAWLPAVLTIGTIDQSLDVEQIVRQGSGIIHWDFEGTATSELSSRIWGQRIN